MSNEERFRLLTGETPQTLYYGKLITCAVTGFAYKKPTREELDSANPTRNDETNLWKCPFCLLDTFPDLSEVRYFPIYIHLAGIKCKSENSVITIYQSSYKKFPYDVILIRV